MSRISTRDAGEFIVEREPFDTHGGMSAGQTAVLGSIFAGRLPARWREVLRGERPTYVVTSYSTPIAWWSLTHGWTVPAVRYSVTTSRHQGIVRAAVGTYREELS